jgi:hypothetical protein
LSLTDSDGNAVDGAGVNVNAQAQKRDETDVVGQLEHALALSVSEAEAYVIRREAVMRLGAVAVLGYLLFASPVLADNAYFWVVGSAAKGCWIVQKNPIVDGGGIQFSDGPYRSQDDAKLAMTTIRVCKT